MFVDPAAANTNAALATATDGALLWEIGFTDENPEFWIAQTPTNDITASLLGGFFAACVNTTFTAATAPELLPHDHLSFGLACDVQLTGGFEALNQTAAANFQAQTDTDLYVRVLQVPEPASVALFGLGLLLAVPFLRRRGNTSA